jgi:hypothetical protein
MVSSKWKEAGGKLLLEVTDYQNLFLSCLFSYKDQMFSFLKKDPIANLESKRKKLLDMMKSPEIVSKALQQNDDPSLSEEEIINGFNSLDRVWEELFPAEQSRILHLLIEKLEVRQEGLRLTVRTEGFHGLAKELKEGVQNAA